MILLNERDTMREGIFGFMVSNTEEFDSFDRIVPIIKEGYQVRHAEEMFTTHDWLSEPMPKLKPTYAAISQKYAAKEKCIDDPTQLILVNEADRLKMASLEQMRAIFDAGGIGLVLIGMPGLEKRLARYAQFYSRIGFVHEFRPLNVPEMRRLLAQGWEPEGVTLPTISALDAETAAAIIRVMRCFFRCMIPSNVTPPVAMSDHGRLTVSTFAGA